MTIEDLANQNYTEISFDLISALADKGDLNAIFYLAFRWFDVGEYEKAFELWKRGAAAGDRNCRYRLGCAYYYGCGVERDEKLADYWVKKSGFGYGPSDGDDVEYLDKSRIEALLRE